MTTIADHDRLVATIEQQKLLIEDLRTTAFKHDDELDELRSLIADQADTMEHRRESHASDLKALESKIDASHTRRRMNRSISTKGIVQYDGTVEASGLTREEFKAEQAWMDELQTQLQPQFEEFVQPLPKGGNNDIS